MGVRWGSPVAGSGGRQSQCETQSILKLAAFWRQVQTDTSLLPHGHHHQDIYERSRLVYPVMAMRNSGIKGETGEQTGERNDMYRVKIEYL